MNTIQSYNNRMIHLFLIKFIEEITNIRNSVNTYDLSFIENNYNGWYIEIINVFNYIIYLK